MSKFDEKKQKNIKTLSKVIEVVVKIVRIFCIILIPFLVLSMVTIPYFIKNIDVFDNKIVFNGFDEKITLVEKDADDNVSIVVKVNDEVVSDTNLNSYVKFKEVITNNSKTKMIVLVETYFVFLIAMLTLIIIMFKNVERLFNNIRTKETPFILDNVSCIKKVSYLMIATMVLPIVLNLILGIILNYNIGFNINLFNIIIILVMFVLAYVFEYGCELQKNSRKVIYEEKE